MDYQSSAVSAGDADDTKMKSSTLNTPPSRPVKQEYNDVQPSPQNDICLDPPSVAATKKSKDPKAYLISIEGNISAGKSSLMRYLAGTQQRWNTIFIPEAIERFERFENYNPLALMYENPRDNVAMAQIHFTSELNAKVKEYLIPRITHDDDVANSAPILVIQDRSLMSPEIFIMTHYRLGYLNNFAKDLLVSEMRKTAYDTIQKCRIQQIGLFYIDTPIEECLERINKRGRYGENTITKEYLEMVREAEEDFLKKIPEDCIIRRTKGNSPTRDIASEFEEFMDHLARKYFLTPKM